MTRRRSNPDRGKQTHCLRKPDPHYESLTPRSSAAHEHRLALRSRHGAVPSSQAAAPTRRGASRGRPLSVEPFLLGGELYALSVDEIPAELVVQRASTGDVFRLGFEATVEGPCMRCLAAAVASVDVEAREYQATDAGVDDELRSEYVVEGDLDLDAWARDLIGLEPPRPDPLPRRLCRPVPGLREGPQRRAARARRGGRRLPLGGARGAARRRPGGLRTV